MTEREFSETILEDLLRLENKVDDLIERVNQLEKENKEMAN